MTLAEDLVTAAAQAMQGAAYGPATKRKARLAVVAILRRLATYRGDGPPVQWDFYTRPDLVRLADEIERSDRG